MSNLSIEALIDLWSHRPHSSHSGGIEGEDCVACLAGDIRAALEMAPSNEALRRIEMLARWYESHPNWKSWGIHNQIRMAIRGDIGGPPR